MSNKKVMVKNSKTMLSPVPGRELKEEEEINQKIKQRKARKRKVGDGNLFFHWHYNGSLVAN